MTTLFDPPFRWRDWTAPRYWGTWIGLGCMWLLTRLPADRVMAFGRRVGPLIIKLIPGRQRIVERNLELALPDTDHDDIARRSAEHAGMGAMEISWLWFRGAQPFKKRFTVEGAEHIEKALASGRGVIVLQAHFTLIDMCAPYFCERWPSSCVYDPPKNGLFGVLQARSRCEYLTAVIANDDIRNMVRRLRRGELVWFSPDQAVSARNGGIATRFFDQPVLTSSGTARILKMTNALLVPYMPTRSDDGRHYRLRFDAPVDLDTTDVTTATQAVNDLLEAQVREQPEQYLWAHRRFKPPKGSPQNPYVDIR